MAVVSLRRVPAAAIPRIAAENLLESDPEVVVENRVEHRVHHGVRVAEPEEEGVQGVRHVQPAHQSVQRVQREEPQPTPAETRNDYRHADGGAYFPLVEAALAFHVGQVALFIHGASRAGARAGAGGGGGGGGVGNHAPRRGAPVVRRFPAFSATLDPEKYVRRAFAGRTVTETDDRSRRRRHDLSDVVGDDPYVRRRGRHSHAVVVGGSSRLLRRMRRRRAVSSTRDSALGRISSSVEAARFLGRAPSRR